MLATSENEQMATAEAVCNQIPASHPIRPLANQALADIMIQQHQYSQAWLRLHSEPASQKDAPPGVRLQHEKLVLWLLLESKSKAKAEEQFKRLVSLSIDKAVSATDRDDVWYFLGATIQMLEAAGEESPVDRATVRKAKEFIEKSQFESAKSMFSLAYEKAWAWSQLFNERSSEFASGGVSKLEESLQVSDNHVSATIAEVKSLQDSINNENANKRQLENKHRSLARERYGYQQEMKRETPNKPIAPREPKRSDYKYDRKDKDKDGQNRRGDDGDAEYRSDLARYERMKDEHDRRFKEWLAIEKARRLVVQQAIDKVSQAIEVCKGEIQIETDAIKQSKRKLQEAEKRLAKAVDTRKITELFIENAKGKTLTTGQLMRPANYPLLDFEREATRIGSAARKLAKSG